MEYILSFDSGTTATKVGLFDVNGNILATSTREYKLITPSPLEVEIKAETLWDAFKEGTKKVLEKSKVNPHDIRAIGISAQGETLVPIDKEGKPLRNAIVWLDNRSQKEAEILQEKFGEDVYKITGQVSVVPTWPAAKIFWIRRNEPHVFEKVYKYLLCEDYMIYQLTGKFVAEGSLLCSTVFWNIITKKWWDEMLETIGISADSLPEIKEPGEPVAELLPRVASELGLSTKTVVCTGALDQVAGAVGVGNIKPGIFSENTGAALAICAPTEKPVYDPQKRMPAHYFAMPNTYMCHTFTTGGMVLKWFRDEFCQTEKQIALATNLDTYDFITREAAQVPLGSEGLVMLPHLQGAMAPEANPKAKGVFYGFTLRHTKAHFARAVMEAIACVVRRNIDVLNDLGIRVNEIRLLGGGAKSRLWSQIKADVTQKPTITLKVTEEAACLGAAILAGNAVGMFNGINKACQHMISIKEKFDPNPANFEIYNKTYERYLQLYSSLCELFSFRRY